MVVLEDCLYVGVSLCTLCGFNTFGARAVFSTDACHLFPQHVLAVIPLIEGVQMQWPMPGPGVLGGGSSSRVPPEHMRGAEAAHNCSWSLGGVGVYRDCSRSLCRLCPAA